MSFAATPDTQLAANQGGTCLGSEPPLPFFFCSIYSEAWVHLGTMCSKEDSREAEIPIAACLPSPLRRAGLSLTSQPQEVESTGSVAMLLHSKQTSIFTAIMSPELRKRALQVQ